MLRRKISGTTLHVLCTIFRIYRHKGYIILLLHIIAFLCHANFNVNCVLSTDLYANFNDFKYFK
jgi:hypothetical protein